MSMQEFEADIQAMYHKADGGASLPALMEGICEVFQRHGEELRGVTYSYRLCATDTGYVKAFSLVDGHFYEKTEADEADVIVSATERNLLAVLQRRLSPMSALLRGKIKLNGSKAALIRLAEYL